jgi:hypothetical protein
MLINSPNISGSLTVTGNSVITGSLTVLGGINGAITGSATTASYVEYTNVANKPALVSGSSQVTYSGLTGVPSGIVSGSSQVTYSGLTGIPSGIVSGSAQVASFGIFATTGSNGFNGSQSITGSLTVTGQVVAQTLNVQQVTSSIVYSSGSNIFGNTLANTQQFTGSVSITGSLNTSIAALGSAATTFLTSDGGTIKSRTAAQTLSDIAALPLAGGTLTGALNGTKFAFSSLSNSDWAAAIDNLGTTGANGLYVNIGASSTGKPFAVYKNFSQLFGVENSGAATFSSSVSGNALSLYTSYASGRQLNFGFSDGSVLPTAAFYIGNQTAVGVFIGDETTTNGLYVKQDGKVGIGTASPVDKLEIYAGTYNKIRTFFEGSYTSGFKFSDYNGGIRYDAAVDRLILFGNYPNVGNITFETAGSEKVRILPTGGITFNGDTAAANALDDYEEGNWTPVPTSTGATFNTAVNGTYTKIGRLVYITCQLDNSSAPTGTLTNEMSITGLPFTSSPGSGFGASLAIGFEVYIDYPAGGLGIQARIPASTTSISLRFTKDDASGDDFLASNFDWGDARIALAGCYEV